MYVFNIVHIKNNNNSGLKIKPLQILTMDIGRSHILNSPFKAEKVFLTICCLLAEILSYIVQGSEWSGFVNPLLAELMDTALKAGLTTPHQLWNNNQF